MDILFSNFSNIGNAIGWSLIHFLWQGLLLFVSYWIITRIFLKNKIHLQYWVGITFIIMCLVIPFREFFIQLGNNNSISIAYQLGISVGIINTAGILSPMDLFISVVQKIIPYLVIFWMISVILISTHLAKSWFSLVKLSKRSSNKVPENLLDKLNSISKKLRLKFKPIIAISKKIDIPATFGFFKPVVLLPTSLINRLPQDQMEAILLHEICHIKRADFLHNILQLLLETLFFYHPLTKWISKDVRKVREQCCDELVLELNANPLVYAKALTNIASIYNNYSNTNPVSNIQIAASDGELLNRIKFLMIEKRSKSPFINLSFGLILSLLLLFIFKNIINENNSSNSFIASSSYLPKPLAESSSVNDKPNYTIPNIKEIISQQKGIIDKNNARALKKLSISRPNTIKKEISPMRFTTPLVKEKNSPEIRDNSRFTPTNINTALPLKREQPIVTIPPDTSNKTVKNIITKKKNAFPKLIRKVEPYYRQSLRQRGIQGTVILSFNIDTKGRVKNIIVDKSSPKKLLDSSAKNALKQWRFDKHSVNEVNINNRYQQIFSYEIKKGENLCKNANTGSRISTPCVKVVGNS